MAADTFAVAMVAALQAALTAAPGVMSVNVQGTTVTYMSTTEMRDAYDYWTSRVARANGARPRSFSVYLGHR